MKLKLVLPFLVSTIILTFSGCGTTAQNDLLGAYNMTQCEYKYQSLSDLTVSGIKLSSGSSLSVQNIAKLTGILSGNASSIPLNLTVNMNVKNPNQSAAMLQRLQYHLQIDGIDFTDGTLNQAISIPAGASQVVPVTMGVDIATLMKSNSQSALLNIVKNIAGVSGEKSTVTLNLRPTFNIAGQLITSPILIPVSFTLGGN